MQRFSCPTELICGMQALDALRNETAESAVLVSDPYFVQSGEADRISALLSAKVTIFDKVTPDPPLRTAVSGAAMLDQLQPELLLALGGGSAIDCAKAMLCLAAKRPRFIAIPTTSGSGSEVTAFSILTHDRVKYPLIDPTIRPDCAILDPALAAAMPGALAADTGMDTLSHCLEALAATGASNFTAALALQSFHTVYHQLPASYRGDSSARAAIHIAASMAGIAFNNAGLGVCPALSHALGGAFHLAHGRLNGILLPAVIAFNAGSTHAYARLAHFCGFSSAADAIAVRSLIAALRRLRRTLSLPATLSEAGISENALQLAESDLITVAKKDACLATNPRPVMDDDLKQLLWEAYQHG